MPAQGTVHIISLLPAFFLAQTLDAIQPAVNLLNERKSYSLRTSQEFFLMHTSTYRLLNSVNDSEVSSKVKKPCFSI